MILDGLERHDLARVCQTCSVLRDLARPMFYKAATFSKFGLHFPGAPAPYPFLRMPEFGNEPLKKDQLQRLVDGIWRLKVPWHSVRDCAAFTSWRIPEYDFDHVDVLYLEMMPSFYHAYHKGDIPGSFVHSCLTDDCGHFFGNIDGWPSQESRSYTFRQGCFFMNKGRVWDALALKVVIRGAPTYWEEENPSAELSKRWMVAKELVLVVISSIWHKKWRSFSTGCSDETWQWGFRPIPPQAVQDLTIAFHTFRHADGWVPPCMHCKDYAPLEGLEDWSEYTPCRAEHRMWTSLAAMLPDTNVKRLTLVNGTSIVKEEAYTGHTVQESWKGKWPQFKPRATQEEVAQAESRIQEYLRDWGGEIRFVSMCDWIKSGAADDALRPTDIQAYLNDEDRPVYLRPSWVPGWTPTPPSSDATSDGDTNDGAQTDDLEPSSS